MSAVDPRQNAPGSRETGEQDRNCEPVDGKSLWAAWVGLGGNISMDETW